MENTLLKYVLIAVGGAAGSVLRCGVQEATRGWFRGEFPLGTLIVNVLGCFAIGVLGVALTEYWAIRAEYRIGLIGGVLGGFTTFSAFGWETVALSNGGKPMLAGAYVGLSVMGGMAAVWLGYRLATRVLIG